MPGGRPLLLPHPRTTAPTAPRACRTLQVQRSELESIKPGARVWERKGCSLFFLSSKEEALAHNEDALRAAKATAAQEAARAREAEEQALQQRESAWP